ncbi:MAG: permease-like cell division protein FtsX [Candidatus Saccharibacteria bacterium]
MSKNNPKRSNRKLLTFFRMFRYGFDSFIRNSWLSIAATAVMTITLMIIFVSFAAQNILTDTVSELRNKVDMSIYLKTETTDKDATEVTAELKKLSSVKSVTYISAATAREKIIEANKDDNAVLDAIKEATNKNPATLRVVIADINDTSQLQDFVANNSLVKDHINPDYKPSFAGERRKTIESIGRAVAFAQKIGIAAGSVFVVISALIIFNTIRMAIFNRREEIQMMKLIGANQSFIRGPFLVEAVIYGIIAAILATGSGAWALLSAKATLTSYQISVQPTIDLLTSFGWIVVLAMIVIGAVIGVISSLFATYKHLKV